MDDELVKDHETRMLLLDHIRENPGITFQLLRSTFKLKEGTLRYHLDHLIRRKRIMLEKKGRERCYYSSLHKRFPFNDPKIVLTDRQERILAIISEEPGIHIKEIRKRSRLDRASFNYNLQKLKGLKLIWRIRNENGYGYEVVTKKRLAEEMFIVVVKKFLRDELDKKTLMEIIEDLEEFRDMNSK